MKDKRNEMKENFIKKLWCILIATITVGIFLTACGSRGEDEAEQESRTEEQDELQTETQSDVQVEFQTETQSEQEVKMNHDNWAQAYLSVIDELRENRNLDVLEFSLLYVNDDDIPELVFGPDGCWVSVYTWQDGQVYIVMDQRPCLWMRTYTYVPFQNSIKSYVYDCLNYDDDGYTSRYYEEFYQMAETTYELEYIYGLIMEDIIKYADEAGGMEPSTTYYVEQDRIEREITEEEYNAYYVREEEDIKLRGNSSADEIINELVKAGGQQLSKDEGEAESTLPDITWDDYNSGSLDTWLHFSFSDGTEVDEELSLTSIVKNVDYVDITGDGKGEVLIYRYFANTATEYTLINIFQIEENCVTEISPELELEELANDVWSVIDMDFSEEEYDMPVFTMESYGKMNALAYPDKRVLVGYQGGGWQILEWFDYHNSLLEEKTE